MGHFQVNEGARLKAIYRYGIVDSPAEREFDDFTELAAEICETPVALISIVEQERQWFKSAFGTSERETPLNKSLCRVAIDQDGFMEVPNAVQDERFLDNPWVQHESGIRFYAGALLRDEEGTAIGTLCVIDYVPRVLTQVQRQTLQVLAKKVSSALELRVARRQLQFELEQAERVAKHMEWEGGIFESMAKGQPIHPLLEQITMGIAVLIPGCMPSIQIVREGRLWHGASPAMPPTYSAIVDGMEIGPEVGSCGTAAYLKSPVIVSDIATDPLWKTFREIASQYKLAACWAYPVLNSDGEVVATFALYWEGERSPIGEHAELIRRTAHLVRLALERDTKDRRLRESEARFRRTFRDAAVGIAVSDMEGNFLDVNSKFCEMMAYSVEELKSKSVKDVTFPQDWIESDTKIQELVDGTQSSFIVEKRYIQNGGGIIWGRVSVSVLLDQFGEGTQLVAVVQDITAEKIAEEKARRQEVLMKIAGEVARVGGWTLRPPDMQVESSETTLAITGMEQDEVSLQTVLERCSEGSRRELEHALQRCLDRGLDFELDLEFEKPSGEMSTLRVMGRAEKDSAGEVIQINGALVDVTETRTLAENLSRTLETITDAFMTFNRDWKLTYMNTEAERIMGVNREEVLGTNPLEDRPSSDYSFRNRYIRAAETGKSERFEAFYEPLGRWFSVSAHPSPDGVAVYFHDVSEAHEQRERLREQATLLDCAQDAIIVRDLDHRVRYWNRSSENLYGWSAAEVEGRKIFELLYADPLPFFEATAATLSNGEWIGEMEHLTKEGGKVAVEGRWTLVRNENGTPKSILAINTDITERQRLERQFLRAQRLETVGTLAGGIAHDLNNVLTPILMSISMLQEEEEDETKMSNLNVIRASAQRGADMVRQLLGFARGTDGESKTVRVMEVISEIEMMIRESFPKNIELEVEIVGEVWSVEGDATQLHQLLVNLCVNARDAMSQGGQLKLRLHSVVLDDVYSGMSQDAQPGSYIVVEVQDSGHGMSQATVDRIFEPFFTTKPIGKGTGLGLSTVHAIVRNHKGFMRVYSEPGKGSTFRVFLPASLVNHEGGAVPIEFDLPRGNGQMVLLVDDEESIRKVAQRTLEYYGYRVESASNGAEAVSIYAQRGKEIDLVLTDMAMPIMDGPATVVALMSMNPEVRVICSSGLDSNAGRAKVSEAGVRHFLPKPYTAGSLLNVVNAILSED